MVYTFWVVYQYLCISREIKRLESISKSPVFVLFSETLNGLPIIRAFRQEERFYQLCCERVDAMNRCHLYLWICNRWLNFRMQCLGAVVAGLVGLGVVYYTSASTVTSSSSEGHHIAVSASAAGLALLYSMGFCDNLTFLARAHADTQMDLNSIERIREYTEIAAEQYQLTEAEEKEAFQTHSPQEEEGISSLCACLGPLTKALALMRNDASSLRHSSRNESRHDNSDRENGHGSELEMRVLEVLSPLQSDEVSRDWPSAGEVIFDRVTLQYPSTSKPILQQLSFHLSPGKKIGICGRSGAGKSSLIVALFR